MTKGRLYYSFSPYNVCLSFNCQNLFGNSQLTALDVYIRPKTIAICIGYSASYSQNFEKSTQCFR